MVIILTNLEKILVEDISVFLPVLPQDNLAEVRVVDQSVHIDLIGHVDHLLLTGIEAESLHRIKGVLREFKFRNGKFLNYIVYQVWENCKE